MEKTLLIDGDSLIYYEAHREDIQEAIEGIDRRMKRIFEDCGHTSYHLFLTEGRCFRYDKAITKEYKHSRKDKVKPTFFRTLRGYLKDTYGAISIPGIEADDAVAFLKIQYPDKTIICSPDKDVLQQTPGEHYNYQMVKEPTYKAKGTVETSESEADNFLWLQMLMGDSTDGISGIEGVGPKKAEKILNEYVVEPSADPFVIILNRYIEKYGAIEGTHRFHETFKLVYLLKTPEDFKREKLDKSLEILQELIPLEYSYAEEEMDEW
jgi:5'-3' exonuclease